MIGFLFSIATRWPRLRKGAAKEWSQEGVLHYDEGYKQLFSRRRMVEDLLRGFVVGEAWISEVDFSTLERKGAGHVGDDPRKREGDMVWRVRVGERWLWLTSCWSFNRKRIRSWR